MKQQVEQQLQKYKKFRALTQEWIDKAIQLAKMKVDMQKAQNLKDGENSVLSSYYV